GQVSRWNGTTHICRRQLFYAANAEQESRRAWGGGDARRIRGCCNTHCPTAQIEDRAALYRQRRCKCRPIASRDLRAESDRSQVSDRLSITPCLASRNGQRPKRQVGF